MAFRAHIIKHFKFDKLNRKQREELKKKFRDHKKELRAAMKAVDRGLKKLKKK